MEDEIQNLNDVFIYNMHQIYFIEKFLVIQLGKLENLATAKDLKSAIKQHRKETINHVNNIERVFSMTGLRREEKKLTSWHSMDQELDALLKVINSNAYDMFILQAIVKSERLEISHYEALIQASKKIDIANKKEVVSLLKENIRDEKKALLKATISMKKEGSFWKKIMPKE